MILEELDTEFGRIRIIQSEESGVRTYSQGGCYHSQINAEGMSTCAYVHVMYSVIRQSGARKILMIGCAGGTLATMLHRIGCEVTVVDINPHAFTLARKYFGMPDEIECVVEDGWSYMRRTGTRFDAVAMDAFSSDGTVPEQFTGEGFFRGLQEVLEPSGVVVMNVMVDHDIDPLADGIALDMEKAGLPVMLYDWPGRVNRNTLVAGGAVERIWVTPCEKPEFIRDEVRDIVRRAPRKRAAG